MVNVCGGVLSMKLCECMVNRVFVLTLLQKDPDVVVIIRP